MSDELTPALTPEEWARRHDWGGTRVVRSFYFERVPSPNADPTTARLIVWDALDIEEEDGTLADVKADAYEVLDPAALHRLAALALDGQPFGPKREYVDALREAIEHSEACDVLHPTVADVWGESRPNPTLTNLRAALAFIESLLPPV